MPLTQGIDVPAVSGWPSGVMSAGRPLTAAGWEGGVEFSGVGCVEPVVAAQCATFSDEPAQAGVSSFAAFTVRQSAICSTMSGGLGTVAADRLAQSTEWALGNELATGTVTGNPSLADAELVSAVADPGDAKSAVGCLLGAAGAAGFGVPLAVHVNLRALPFIESKLPDYVDQFIVSPGYPNDTAQLWVTGPVYWAVSDVLALDDVDHTVNVAEQWAQAEALAAFDPCLNLTATIAVTCAAE